MDISGFIYKYKASAGTRWLTMMFNLFCMFRSMKLFNLSIVFDGKPPIEKKATGEEREEAKLVLLKKAEELERDIDLYNTTGEKSEGLIKEMDRLIKAEEKRVNKGKSGSSVKKPSILRNKSTPAPSTFSIERLEQQLDRIKGQINCRPSPEDIINIKMMATAFGIPWYHASSEAETFCASMCKKGLAEVVISEDSDVFAYGWIPICVSKIELEDDSCEILYHAEILSHLGLTRDEFRDLCILCGTDYNKRAFKFGPATALKNIQKHGSIPTILTEVKWKHGFAQYNNYQEVRDIFDIKRPQLAVSKIMGDGKEPLDFDELKGFKEITSLPSWKINGIEQVLDFLEEKGIKYFKKSVERFITEKYTPEILFIDEEENEIL